MLKKYTHFIFIMMCLFILESQEINAQKNLKTKISFKDSIDGAFDISEFLYDPKGFVPIPIIITEPSVGYGGGLGLFFIQPKKKKYKNYVPPNVTGVVGLATENNTWAASLFHFRVFGNDRIRSFSLLAKPYVNINYYGNNNNFLSKNPVEFNLDSWFFVQRIQARIKDSKWFLGAAYIFFKSKTSFNEFTNNDIINKLLQNLEGNTTISLIQPIVNWDSRDNIFTPNKGLNTGFTFSYNAEWLGATDDYYAINPYFLYYKPISKKVYSSWRFDSHFMLGNAPFYANPFVEMRGVPYMKYQSDNTMLVETEWKYKLNKRWAVDVFTGAGKAFQSFNNFGPATWVYNYGFGFRYTISRAFNIDTGIDFAWSNNKDFAFSIIFGSAWNK